MKYICILTGTGPAHERMMVKDDGPLTLERKQELVGGWIERVRLFGRVALYCNEEGKLMGLEPNFVLPAIGDLIVGNAIIVAEDREGEQVDMTNEELNKFGWARVTNDPGYPEGMIINDKAAEDLTAMAIVARKGVTNNPHLS